MEAEVGLNCTAAIMTSGPLLSMTVRALASNGLDTLAGKGSLLGPPP